MKNKNAWKYQAYLGVALCPRCGKRGYVKLGIIMMCYVAMVDHRVKHKTVKSCYF